MLRMKTSRKGKNANCGAISNPSSGHTTPQDIQEDDDDDPNDNGIEGDEGDDESEDPIATASPAIDTCLASHEFEWLTPGAQTLPESVNPLEINTEIAEARNITIASAAVPPQSQQHKSRKCGTCRQRRVKEHECLACQISPTPCYDNHMCRHRLSPMRSSWCCPSPPPHLPVCLHHGGGSITGMEVIPYGQECCPEDCVACYCMPPSGHQQVRHCSPGHHYGGPHYGEFSPVSPQKTYRNNSGPRSQSLGPSRMRNSPSSSPLHRPYYTNEVSHLLLPHTNMNMWDEQWKPPHAGDTNSMQKIQHLESEKKNLKLQVSVLTDQVEAQTDKIHELESMLDENKDVIKQMDKNLHAEMMSRSALENGKLDLITELSSLRLRLTASEQDRRDSDDRCRKVESDMQLMFDHYDFGEIDGRSSSKGKLLRNGTLFSSEKNNEVEKLHATLESVIAANEEKDRKIEELRLTVIKYKKLQDYVLAGHQRKASDVSNKDGVTCEVDSSKDFFPPPSPGCESLKSQCYKLESKPPSGHRGNSNTLPCTSLPMRNNVPVKESLTSLGKMLAMNSDDKTVPSITSAHKSNSLENIWQGMQKMSSPKSSYGTVPRQNGPQVLQHLQEQLQIIEGSSVTNHPDGPRLTPSRSLKNKEMSRNARNKSSGVSFGKGFFKLRKGKRSSSAPELAPFENETISLDEREVASAGPTPQPTMQPFFVKPEKERSRGLFKYFTKWKRSGSQNIETINGEFRRGGIRATAGPRLGWSRDISLEPDIPFSNWSNNVVVEWLHKIGLNMYMNSCRRWKCNGEQLLNANLNTIEKELNIKNPLHKKKLTLALQRFKSTESIPESITSMDHHWVIRWLDDVGLPQYKDSFMESRVDGRMLHYLTVDDLLNLKVTHQLHHVSIKRGIQVLREKNFDPHCLVRRSSVDEDKNYTAENVALWTNHRVMEWLRTVDLSEYAPNLRGSGVHGALIIYETKFNADLFATLLNIPPSKTLLRRHLATHFKTIVGSDYSQVKRDVETDQLFTPLTPNVKIKGVRKTQFALKKKKSKGENEIEEFVCPMDIPVRNSITSPSSDKLIVRRNSDPASHESRIVDLNEDKSIAEIGAVSKEITSLTDMIEEETLNNAPTSNV